jgi:membrane protease YdiL (CAAX protease family)
MGNWRSEFRRGRIVLAFLSVAFVLTLTHLPPDAIPEVLPRVLQAAGSDKIEHGLAYALITMSFLFAVNWRMNRRLWVIIILGIAAVGAADEITQPFMNRDCSGWDWMADLVGITAGCAVALLKCRCCRTAGAPNSPTDSIEPDALIREGHSR